MLQWLHNRCNAHNTMCFCEFLITLNTSQHALTANVFKVCLYVYLINIYKNSGQVLNQIAGQIPTRLKGFLLVFLKTKLKTKLKSMPNKMSKNLNIRTD